MTTPPIHRATSITAVQVTFRLELGTVTGELLGAFSRDDITMAGVPRPGDTIAIGWLPQHLIGTEYGMIGWHAVHHIEHFPSQPWDPAGGVAGLGSACCVIHIEHPARAMSVALRDAMQGDGWHVTSFGMMRGYGEDFHGSAA